MSTPHAKDFGGQRLLLLVRHCFFFLAFRASTDNTRHPLVELAEDTTACARSRIKVLVAVRVLSLSDLLVFFEWPALSNECTQIWLLD